MENDWVLAALAVGLTASVAVIVVLVVDRLIQQNYVFQPTAYRHTEYVRDSQGRIISRYEEVGITPAPAVNTTAVVRETA